MAYVYIVTRVCMGNVKFKNNVPNLGVYGKLATAHDHFDLVKKYRLTQEGCRLGYDVFINMEDIDKKERRAELRRAMFKYENGSMEELVLERWRVPSLKLIEATMPAATAPPATATTTKTGKLIAAIDKSKDKDKEPKKDEVPRTL